MTALSTRIVVRLAEDDSAWIAAQAAEEGVDNATFVRMVLNRVRRGKPALIGMAATEAAPLHTQPAAQYAEQPEHDEQEAYADELGGEPAPVIPAEHQPEMSAERALTLRMQSLGPAAADLPPIPRGPAPSTAPSAHSLWRAPRVTYNPGRTGFG